MLNKNESIKSSIGGGAPQQPDYIWLCGSCFFEISDPCERKQKEMNMIKKAGFTMAEILLSLTIIGVVAAITLPSLMANINERTWNTQRKALYARMSQAIAMMPQVGGYGTLTEDGNGSVTVDTAAESFLTEGLSKVLKINNICDSEHLADCGLSGQITNILGGVVSAWPKSFVELNGMFSGVYSNPNYSWEYHQTDTKAAAFETQNGESVALYYNPNCLANLDNEMAAVLPNTQGFFVQPMVCANFIYDLNGSKGPNTTGKDIGFITVISPTDSIVVSPVLGNGLATSVYQGIPRADAAAACVAQDPNSRVLTVHESIAVFTNKEFVVGPETASFTGTEGAWTSQKKTAELSWLFNIATGHLMLRGDNWTANVLCVKR